MFEQDYVMRLIKEMVRTILKLYFNIDTENPAIELLENEETKNELNELLKMIDDGNINLAENQLCEMTSDGSKENLKLALLFYSYLNDKDDEFLLAHDFSRDEIKQGIKDLASRYGIKEMIDVFLMNEI